MKRVIAFAYVLGLFFLGGVIGALGLHLYYSEARMGPPPHRRVNLPGPAAGGHSGLPRLFHLLDGSERLGWLDLTEAQRTEIAGILEKGRREMDALRAELRPRIERHAQDTREKIDAVLTPEQSARLAEDLEHTPRRRRHGPPSRP